MSDNSEDIADMLEKMLLTIGKQVSNKFKVNAAQVMPDENGHISNTIKPMMKMAKEMFKGLLGQNFDSNQLSSLGSMFNLPFLDGINKTASNGPNKSPIALAIQLLTNIGIPLLKSVIGHAQSHQKKEENKGHPANEGANAKEKNTFHPRKRAMSVDSSQMHRAQMNVVTPELHRKNAPK